MQNVPTINDVHVHLREGDMTKLIAPYSGAICANIVAMPNTKRPIKDAESIQFMHSFYQEAVGPNCKVHMTAKLLPEHTAKDVLPIKKAGAIGFKLYPAGATTNSEDGIPIEWLRHLNSQMVDLFKCMEDENMVLLCHGEVPKAFCMDRESQFLPIFEEIAQRFPKLRMTLEHISTIEGAETVKRLNKRRGRMLGTITLHHMLITHDDVVGAALKPQNHCMPTPKRPQDRGYLLLTAKQARHHMCFAFGSDSAPHFDNLNCGVFSAPVLLPSLFKLLQHDMKSFHHFCVENARLFYGFEKSERKIALDKVEWIVPSEINGIIPFRAGEILQWKVM